MMSLIIAVAHPILLLVLFSAWVWCLVDALRNHRPWGWVLFVAAVPVASVPFYVMNYRVFGTPDRGALDQELHWAKRLRELEEQARETDVAGVHREIADIHFQRGQHRRAVESLKRVLDMDPEDLRSQYQAGVSMASLGHLDPAIAHLEFVVEEDPRYGAGDARLSLANALIAKGQPEKAFHHLALAVRNHNLPEAAIRYARMLRDQGYRDEARACLEEMLEKSAELPQESFRANKRWIKEANTMIEELGAKKK